MKKIKREQSREVKPRRSSYHRSNDGTMYEMIYQPSDQPATRFAKYQDHEVTYVNRIELGNGLPPIVPFPENDLLRNGTILFPEVAFNYDSESKLLSEIRCLLCRYVVLTSVFLEICCYYVLLTWVYDSFTALPYLRVMGDYGTGKSRILKVVGSLCYKPIFAAGASTLSPLFRLIDRYAGTLVIDEGDFPRSDEAAGIVKILNCGHEKGTPVLISVPKNGDWEPTSYQVFGPKILATRKEFQDKALESRCITEHLQRRRNLKIPRNLPEVFWDEARILRNKLLTFRFRNWNIVKVDDSFEELPIEPRLQQIIMPLAGLIHDENLKSELKNLFINLSSQIDEERGSSVEGRVLSIICNKWHSTGNPELTMKSIADNYNELHTKGDRFRISPRRVGNIVRRDFKLSCTRQRVGYVLNISNSNENRLIELGPRFAIEFGEQSK